MGDNYYVCGAFIGVIGHGKCALLIKINKTKHRGGIGKYWMHKSKSKGTTKEIWKTINKLVGQTTENLRNI